MVTELQPDRASAGGAGDTFSTSPLPHHNKRERAGSTVMMSHAFGGGDKQKNKGGNEEDGGREGKGVSSAAEVIRAGVYHPSTR